MRGAERDGEIAVEEADMGRRRRRAELPRGAFDDRPEDDLVPVIRKEVAQQRLERCLAGFDRKELGRTAVRLHDALGTDLHPDGCYHPAARASSAVDNGEGAPLPFRLTVPFGD